MPSSGESRIKGGIDVEVRLIEHDQELRLDKHRVLGDQVQLRSHQVADVVLEVLVVGGLRRVR